MLLIKTTTQLIPSSLVAQHGFTDASPTLLKVHTQATFLAFGESPGRHIPCRGSLLVAC